MSQNFWLQLASWEKKKKKNAIKGETNSATAIQMVGRIAVFYLTITMRRTRD